MVSDADSTWLTFCLFETQPQEDVRIRIDEGLKNFSATNLMFNISGLRGPSPNLAFFFLFINRSF